jgi:hypothetical protein
MAFTATGYDGTVDELGFAQLMLLAGNRHTVPTRASFAATQVGGSRASASPPTRPSGSTCPPPRQASGTSSCSGARGPPTPSRSRR